MGADPHTAVKQELLVRYLDYWVPAALHAARTASYLDGSGFGPAAALPVVAEFADLLAGRELAFLVAGEAGTLPPDPGIPGLHLTAVPLPELAAVVRGSGRAAVFACLDRSPPAAGEAAAPGPAVGTIPAELTAALGAARDGELMLVTGPVMGDPRAELEAAGFGSVVAVELVDANGTAQLLRFATSSARSLERFKDELWAVDQYAGIGYRDPEQSEGEPLAISYEPHPGPLRRALLEQVRQSPRTVSQLREFALRRTLYRPSDVPRALSALLAHGQLIRVPERGRLTGATVLHPS